MLTWVTIRLSTSRPSWTTWPSRLEITGVRGSWVDTERASRPSTSTAGAMCSVWKAPATDSGISRALAGGSSASAASCSTVPAATIWPGPLSLAAVRPCCSSLASTSSRSPPRTAVMLVGVGRRGGGHRLAALADQHHRLLGGDRPGAGGGGELADAVAGDRADPGRTRRPGAGTARGRPAGRRRPAAAGRPRCRGSCPRRPRCRSGPGRGRRRRTASSAGRRRSGSPARASRKPGVWAPWPGATMTSTGPLCRAGGPGSRAAARTKIPGRSL